MKSALCRLGLHRRGIGRGVVHRVTGSSKSLGYYTAHAGVTEPNPASIGLHEAVGFRRAGANRNVGSKDGRWWDVAYLEVSLQEGYGHPTARPRRMDELTTAEREALLAAD